MARIRPLETWVCERDHQVQQAGQGHPLSSAQHTLVSKIVDEDGFEGIGTRWWERSVEVPLAYVYDVIAPLLLGRKRAIPASRNKTLSLPID